MSPDIKNISRMKYPKTWASISVSSRVVWRGNFGLSLQAAYSPSLAVMQCENSSSVWHTGLSSSKQVNQKNSMWRAEACKLSYDTSIKIPDYVGYTLHTHDVFIEKFAEILYAKSERRLLISTYKPMTLNEISEEKYLNTPKCELWVMFHFYFEIIHAHLWISSTPDRAAFIRSKNAISNQMNVE